MYEILDTFEAGIMLNGGEVKSIRSNKISINETYVRVKNGEMWLIGSHIPVPSYVPDFSRFEEKRDRKLLMHKREIIRLKSKSDEKRLTLVITKIYQPDNCGKIKCEIALAKGKNTVDKKHDLMEKDIKREMDRDIKNIRL